MESEKYYTKIFGQRFQNLLDENELTQTEFADQLYLSASALSLYALGKRTPKLETAILICEYFNVSLDYLFGLSAVRKAINQAVTDMPVFKTYVSGRNNYDDENIEMHLPIAKSRFADTNNVFGIRIKSQLMRPRFYENDIAIVERTKEVKSGDIIMVTISNDEAIIRELTTTNGGWVLNPFSPVQPPTFYSWDDMEQQNVRLIGKVVENLVKF